jgi:hypothetical protein
MIFSFLELLSSTLFWTYNLFGYKERMRREKDVRESMRGEKDVRNSHYGAARIKAQIKAPTPVSLDIF